NPVQVQVLSPALKQRKGLRQRGVNPFSFVPPRLGPFWDHVGAALRRRRWSHPGFRPYHAGRAEAWHSSKNAGAPTASFSATAADATPTPWGPTSSRPRPSAAASRRRSTG